MLKQWIKIKEQPYNTNFRKISKVTYRLPNGKLADFDILQGKRIASIFAITKNKKVILAKQFRPGPMKFFYDLPGGRVEKNESPITAAKRELLEETGYSGEIKLIAKTWYSAYSAARCFVFVATDCQKIGKQNLDEHEFIEAIEVSLNKFRTFMRQGKMADIDSAYLALDYLKLL